MIKGGWLTLDTAALLGLRETLLNGDGHDRKIAEIRRELLRVGARSAVVACLWDPAAVRACIAAGVGASLTVADSKRAFHTAFPHVIALLDEAFALVSALDEPAALELWCAMYRQILERHLGMAIVTNAHSRMGSHDSHISLGIGNAHSNLIESPRYKGPERTDKGNLPGQG